MWKLISFEPCHNMLNCFIYISISHLYARVNLIVLTKFHCLNCKIIIGKKFLSLQKPVFISTETFITLDNFTFTTFTPLLFFVHSYVPRKAKVHINESIKYMLTNLKLLEMIRSHNNLFHLLHLSYPWILKHLIQILLDYTSDFQFS